MIRIGLSRWQTIFENKLIGNNQERMCLKMVPQALKYKVLYKKWSGLHSNLETKTVLTKSFEAPFVFERYQKIGYTVEQLKKGANSLASDAVRYCITHDIVDHNGIEVSAVIYLVNHALMRLVETGTSDTEQDLIEEVDLVGDMATMRAERDRQIAEQQRQMQLAYQQHLEDQGIARKYAKEKSEEAIKKSFEFLGKFLNTAEKEMLAKYNCIKVSNCAGDFFIYPSSHAMVDQFIENKYIQSHCVVFKDYTLPVGDETAMKVALLKTDIQRFLQISNKFPGFNIKRMPF